MADVERPTLNGGPQQARRKVHGRRRGKALRPAQIRRLEELLPRLAVPGLERGAPAAVDPRKLFGDERPVWLEIGVGGGEHLVGLAEARPDIGLIGCEPFVNAVAMTLGRIEAAGVANVRLHPGDARDLIDALPAGALARVYLLYPDPWPKTRHAERRFMNAENLAALARTMAPGAELRLATDMPGYVAHALRAVAAASEFEMRTPPEERGTPWPGWRSTRYEAKARAAGRAPAYLVFVRR